MHARIPPTRPLSAVPAHCTVALEGRARTIMERGAAKRTHERWCSTQRTFFRWAHEAGYTDVVPTSPFTLILFCTALAERGSPLTSIRQYVDGVNNLHVSVGYPTPWSGKYAYVARRFKRGLAAICEVAVPKVAMSARLLRLMWLQVSSTDPAQMVIWCGAVVLWHLTCRAGNLMPTTQSTTAMCIKRSSVCFKACSGGYRASMVIPFTKTKRFPVERWFFSSECLPQFCPIYCLRSMLRVQTGRNEACLMVHPKTGAPITRSMFNAQIRQWLTDVPGAPCISTVSAISFRKGAMQELAAAGATKLQVQ